MSKPKNSKRRSKTLPELGEEELSDVSLGTFYVFDKENTGAPPLPEQLRLARGGQCVGCVGYACGGCGG
jgi:hypothetical protein